MDRWEYASIVVYSVDHEQLVETLNNAGAKGLGVGLYHRFSMCRSAADDWSEW